MNDGECFRLAPSQAVWFVKCLNHQVLELRGTEQHGGRNKEYSIVSQQSFLPHVFVQKNKRQKMTCIPKQFHHNFQGAAVFSNEKEMARR